MKLNTTTDTVKIAPLLTSDDIKLILSGVMDGHAYIEAKSGQNERRSRIQKQFADAGVSDIWGTKKEVQALPDIIRDNETIKYATSGVADGNTVLMVSTDQRVLFIDKGLLYGIKSTEIPLNMVNAISYSKGLMLGSITITNGATVTRIENVNKKTALLMVQSINDAREGASHPRQTSNHAGSPESQTLADEIRELKALADDRIITQDEFNAKKRKLLGL
ncbi:PH domain-containing protein [Lacticaseibacillus mingshuiensis]|uniref:PH domain-containing protein n=2 Tax=Lacticaseibacillus mingshuiensis TaxID=2799574 RepID=A0ABW4CKP2_9LACO|nr:PH domain-containing protein [Lacticaseibacillus mingshuiensis]